MSSTFSEPILRTKIYKPLVKDRYIIRQSIIDYLEQNRQNALTLVVAGTGYGKSVTVSEWLDQTTRPHCWLSLDDDCNDLRTFFRYLTYAIRSALPEALSFLYDLLQGPETPPQKLLVKFLLNGLDQTNQEIIIVLDDYHTIDNKQIHETINSLLKNPLPKIHLVIISRHDPALDLSPLRTFGEINELRMSALSFTQDEIIALGERILNVRISEKVAAILLQKTEGWIVGLRMALMQVTKNSDIEKAIQELGAGQQYLRQYLLEAVFQQQPEPVRTLLLTASISDRFSRGLVAAVVEKGSDNTVYPDPALFSQLISSSLFVIPLDEEGQWYRFHQLFHDFLSKHLEKEYTEEEISAYHQRASDFFEKENHYEQAIRHAVKSGDNKLAVQVFVRHKGELLNTDQFARLGKCLLLLPSKLVEEEPQLLLTRALLHDARADYQAMRKDLARVESICQGLTVERATLGHVWGEYCSINACLAYYSGHYEQALKSAGEALALLPNQVSYLRDFALAFKALSLQATGQVRNVSKLLNDLDTSSPSSNSSSRIQLIRMLVCALEGNLTEILDTVPQYRKIFLEERLHVSFVYAVYYTAVAHYQRNELDKVVGIVDEIEDHHYAGRPYWGLHCLFLKGFAFIAQGRMSEFETLLKRLHTLLNDLDNHQLSKFVKGFEVEVALRQNNLEEAWRLSEDADFEPYPPIFYFFFPQLTYVRLLMSSGDPDKRSEAMARLQGLIEFGRSTHRKNLLIQALPLQALLSQQEGNVANATTVMNEALDLSTSSGHIRNFLDLGAPMQVMVQSLLRKEPEETCLAAIKRDFEREPALARALTSKEEDTSASFGTTEIEKVTKRELRLLQLLAEGYQNKEIAEKLYVAPSTVKKALYRIYQKLNVNNRISAVSTATRMSLLKPSDKSD